SAAADLYGDAMAGFTAKMIRLPLSKLPPPNAPGKPVRRTSYASPAGAPDWPWELLSKPILIGIMSAALVALIEARLGRSRKRRDEKAS
ncbi:MAG: hypothetical protein NDJ90_14660, partial [Oligoflexia bacterium]|nr:hypothetical protein [Oligoflexia bacterium]